MGSQRCREEEENKMCKTAVSSRLSLRESRGKTQETNIEGNISEWTKSPPVHSTCFCRFYTYPPHSLLRHTILQWKWRGFISCRHWVLVIKKRNMEFCRSLGEKSGGMARNVEAQSLLLLGLISLATSTALGSLWSLRMCFSTWGLWELTKDLNLGSISGRDIFTWLGFI